MDCSPQLKMNKIEIEQNSYLRKKIMFFAYTEENVKDYEGLS